MEYQKTSDLTQSSTEMAHLHYASADSVHTPSMAIRYSYSESHLRKRRPVNMMPLLPRSYPTRWRLCLLLPTVVWPTRFAQHVSTRGLPARKKENELCPSSRLPAKLTGWTSCRAIGIAA